MRCTCVFFCCCFLHGFNPNVASMVDWAFKYIKLPTTATWVSCLCVDRIHPKEMSVKGFPFFLAIAIYCYEVSPRTVACKFSFTWWSHPYSSCSFLLSDAHSAKSLTHLHCWVIWDCWSLSILHSLCSHVILHEWLTFYSAFLNIHRNGVLTALTWLVPHETAAISACSVYTIQPQTLSLHAKSHKSGACMFSCNLPPALLVKWPGSFTCYCGNTGIEQIPK